jgi:hypothetical protein
MFGRQRSRGPTAIPSTICPGLSYAWLPSQGGWRIIDTRTGRPQGAAYPSGAALLADLARFQRDFPAALPAKPDPPFDPEWE